MQPGTSQPSPALCAPFFLSPFRPLFSFSHASCRQFVGNQRHRICCVWLVPLQLVFALLLFVAPACTCLEMQVHTVFTQSIQTFSSARVHCCSRRGSCDCNSNFANVIARRVSMSGTADMYKLRAWRGCARYQWLDRIRRSRSRWREQAKGRRGEEEEEEREASRKDDEGERKRISENTKRVDLEREEEERWVVGAICVCNRQSGGHAIMP